MGGELGWALGAALGRGQGDFYIWAVFCGSEDGVLLPKLCLLIPHLHLSLAHPYRERTLLVLGHTPNSLRHTGHWAFQLGVLGLNWTPTQLLWPLRTLREVQIDRERKGP